MKVVKLEELILKGIRNKGISKAQLAKRIGCTSRAIEYWISGERTMSLENADKLFKALDLTICIGKRKNESVKVRR